MTASTSNVGSLKNFEIKKKIGEGAFSSVFHVIIKGTNKSFALKKVKIESLNPKEKENALNEVRILASLNHPNIIGYKDAFYEEKHLNIVLEFATQGDLLQKIQQKKKRGELFSEAEVWTALVHLLKGLNALHGLNILHRDIKAANVFITKDKEFKLGDMNVSKVMSTNQMSQTQTGTPFYASPEVWKKESYNSKSDVWSLGCVIYEMAALSPPFQGTELDDLYKKVTKGVFARIPTEFSNDLNNIIKQLLTVSQTLRPSCETLLASAAISKACGEYDIKSGEADAKPAFLLDAIVAPGSWDRRALTDRLPKPSYNQEELESLANIFLTPTPERKKNDSKKRKSQSEKKNSAKEEHKPEKKEREFHLPHIKPQPELKLFDDNYMVVFKKQLDAAVSSAVFKPKSDALQSFYQNISRLQVRLTKRDMETSSKFYQSLNRDKATSNSSVKLEPLALNKSIQKKLQQIYNIRPIEKKGLLARIAEQEKIPETNVSQEVT